MKNSKSVNKPTRTRKSKSHKGNTRITKRRPKRISKPKPLQKKRQQQQQQQQISIKRSSGRKEKFDTNRLAQTVARSGVPFLMARDVAKKVSGKIEHEAYTQQTKRKGKKSSSTQLKEKTVTGGRIRNLVATELRERNRSDIAASYSGQAPENTLQEQSLKDKQPVEDTIASKRNRVLHDASKRGGGVMT
jgi:hypothetical protein